MNKCLFFGALSGMLAVIIGAFGAHGLENTLSEAMLRRYETGVDYHFYHALALIGVGALWQKQGEKQLARAGLSFLTGIILFSGSLYLYALTGISQFGMITPIGGLAFIAGWFFLMLYGWRTRAAKL